MKSNTKKIILFVDDDPVALQLIVEEFKKRFGNKYRYEKAENALEASELMQEYYDESGILPILVVSDWMMPAKRGDDFLIETNQKYPNIQLVLHSGLADKSIQGYLEERCELLCVLNKPWDGEKDFDKINLILN